MKPVIPLACAIALASAPAMAQQTPTMEDRARAAAAASQARTSDSDTLLNNYVTPGLSGQPVATIDNSKTFTPNIACQQTATMMEVLVQPNSGGDLGTVSIARDTDLDGTVDSRSNLPMPVSGICANGVISCQPGTWNQCNFFRWDVDAARNLKLTQVDMPQLAGCYCINNSCGSNLAWNDMPEILRDLGGGMIGALTTADPRYGVAEAVIDGPTIRYVGAQSTACTSNPSLPQTAYQSNPSAISGDAYSTSTNDPVFQALSASQVGTGTALQLRHCTIERQVTVLKPLPEEIISLVSGGYSTIQNGASFDYLMGAPSDDGLIGGSCRLYDFRMTLRVSDADRIVNARLAQVAFDDWVQIRVDGQLVFADPSNWTSNGLPPGACERAKNWRDYPNLDLKPYLTQGDHEIWMRVAVGGNGEAFAQVHVDVDDGCQTLEQVVDECGTIAADPQCRIDSELVDGVQTFINGVATGLQPLPQTRIMGGSSCPTELTRDFFLKDRTYRCQVDDIAKPDTSRGAYIIDHSTETLLADRTQQSDGSYAESTRPFSLPDRGSVPACEAICKTRAPHVNNGAAPDGVVGNQQNDPVGYDTFYHTCDSANHCPIGTGEELVSDCGCLDDFPDAVVMMQTVRLAGADVVCTGGHTMMRLHCLRSRALAWMAVLGMATAPAWQDAALARSVVPPQAQAAVQSQPEPITDPSSSETQPGGTAVQEMCAADLNGNGDAADPGETATCTQTPSGQYLCPIQQVDCVVNATGQYSCPLGAQLACIAPTAGAVPACSPNQCADLKANPITDVPPIDDPGTEPNGTVDADGNCLGTVEIFSGRGMRCRPPGLSTVFSDCCKDKGKIVKDGMGSIGSLGTKIAVAKGVIQGLSAAYKAFQAGETASAAASAGAHALVIGLDPTTLAISLAINFMIEFLFASCDEQDMEAAMLNGSGMCHFIDSYCTSSFLGICLQKAHGMCCFNTKLGRIIQEQGRPQLKSFNGNLWGTAKNPMCRGFTPAEFQALDFSKMDLSEYYADIEARAQSDIQVDMKDRVNAYLNAVNP